MALISRFIGLQVLVLMLFAQMMLGGKASIYIDIPSIVFVLGVLLGGALLCFTPTQLADAFRAVLFGPAAPRVSPWQRQTRVAVFARLYQLSWGGGLVCALTGLIAMLSDLSDPASIGAGMAVALVAPAYGAVLAEFVFNPMQQAVMNQPPTPDDTDSNTGLHDATPIPPAGQSGLWKGVAVIAVIVSMFMVPIVSFSEIKKEDAFSPQQEATYLRYLYGNNATQSQAVSPRLQATADQRELEYAMLVQKLRRMYRDAGGDSTRAPVSRNDDLLDEIAKDIQSIPMPEDVKPSKSHQWRLHLLEQFDSRARATSD